VAPSLLRFDVTSRFWSFGGIVSDFMLCQKCKQKEATVHIAESRGDPPFSETATGSAEFTLHFCVACGEEYQQEVFARTLFPNSAEQPITEQFRVVQSSPDRTIVRLVRTESQPVPVDWSLLTPRLPTHLCSVGKEFTMTFTPSELEFLKGNRDLQ
jgi:hypothetical protein